MSFFDGLISRLVADIKATATLEYISVIAQIASVLYAKRNNVLVYPTGIIGVIIAAYMYMYISVPPLYAEAGLHLYYLALSIYGWYNWVQRKNGGTEAFPISFCTHRELMNGLLLCVFSWLAIFSLLYFFTDSDTPIADSLVSASAVTGMWWMAKRKIENWLAWIFSNTVAIPLNYYKGFVLFAIMYLLFLWLAWLGYKSWKQQVK